LKEHKSCQNCKRLAYNDIWERYECLIKAKRGETYEAWSRLIGREVSRDYYVYNPAKKNKNGDCPDFRWKLLNWLSHKNPKPIRVTVWAIGGDDNVAIIQ